MAKFNISRIVPEGFIHSSGFLEVIDSLAWSLAALEHDVNVTQNWFSESKEHNILFGAELVADFQRLPPGTIIFNLEQPSHPRLDVVRRIAKESDAVIWDYSHRSVADWRDRGFTNVYHVPIGYTPNLTRIPHLAPDYDVFFCGWPTPRRVELLNSLRAAGLRVFFSDACYGGGRDNAIARSRLCLNVHHDGRDRFEIVRCSYLMANSHAIVTEVSSDDDEYADLQGIERVPYRLLTDFTMSLLTNDRQLQDMQMQSLVSIKKRNFVESVDAALKDWQPATPSTAPVMSKPLAHAMASSERKRDYLSAARVLPRAIPTGARDPRVAARYQAALRQGDMKDFVEWMAQHAKGNILEIGVRDGASTSAFLTGLELAGGHLYSVDVQPCGHLFSGHPQWTFIHLNSIEFQKVIAQIPYELDIILIDGDHSKVGVLTDCEYLRQLRPGGMALFHDIAPEPNSTNDPTWPGDAVKEVYESLCRGMAEHGWTNEILPGRYGMGVLRRPQPQPAEVSA